MTTYEDWNIPSDVQPRAEDYSFDLEAALSAVVSLRTIIPADGFTAETLGNERLGNGVLIDGGLVLTVGYLIIEAESIWLTLNDGRAVEGHTLAYDQETGFGLVQPLARLDGLPGVTLGDSDTAGVGEHVVVAGFGGRERSVAAHVVGRQEFAGYWEYMLDDAIFTAPAHPHWGGTALLGPAGELLGVGSLQLQAAGEGGQEVPLNMAVPINPLKPILGDMKKHGRANRRVRPWLGLYSAGMEGEVVVIGLASGGPGDNAGVRGGDVVIAVAGEEIDNLGDFYRHVWAQGEAGVDVPLTILRDGERLEITVTSGDRNTLLKRPSVH